jgi:hypothetical protein
MAQTARMLVAWRWRTNLIVSADVVGGFGVSGIERDGWGFGSFQRFLGSEGTIERVRSFIFALPGRWGAFAPVVESGSFLKFREWWEMLGVGLDSDSVRSRDFKLRRQKRLAAVVGV